MGRVGKLRQRGRLQRRTVTQDAEGGQLETWATYATIWCNVVPHAGEEALTEQRTTAIVHHRVETRYLEGVHPSDRLVLRTRAGADRVLSISSAMDVRSRGRRLMLYCSETIEPLEGAVS